VVRELRQTFTITTSPARTETREYLDTFDWRLFRAGLRLVRIDNRLLLAGFPGGEQLAQGAWHAKSPPRFACDLPGDDLRRLVSAVTDPRALLPVARVRAVTRTIEARTGKGRLPAGMRLETVILHRAGSAKRVTGLVVDTATATTRTAVAAALGRAGFRATGTTWFEALLRAAGRHPTDHAPRPRIAMSPDTPARTALAAILLHLQTVMHRNEAGVCNDTDTEFLHDYRVALRRTRTALGELKGVFPEESAREFRERFRVLAAPTSVVRDLDVHLGRREQYGDRLPEEFRAGLESVFVAMEGRRVQAREVLVATLTGREYKRLMREWKAALNALADGRSVGIDAEEPALDLGRRAIRRRYERLREIAVAVESLDDDALHRARLNGKKLRYLIEFFQDGLGRRAASLLTRMEDVQDALGEFNDLGVQLRVFRDALRKVPGEGPVAMQRAAALGGIIALLEARRRKVRRRCERRLRAFRGPLRLEMG
jgi:CHAD domain-containing protein